VLQQTRVSTVIPYFNNWVAKWPTVEDLAKANHDEVLAVWKGLGYYSRATRLYEGAQATMKDGPDAPCVIPSGAAELRLLPGIGRYTAGAISSIAFGEAEPVLDGNVARVLSRQLGLYVDVKDKKHSDTLWEVADQLIKQVSDYPSTQNSAVPGQWNQALMELGSTICTPRPRCDECPISSTCRAYSEGQALASKRQSPTTVPDIEDACTVCEQLDTEDLVAISAEAEAEEAPEPAKRRKTSVKQSNTLSNYFAMGTRSSKAKAEEKEEEKDAVDESQSGGARKRKNPAPSPGAKSISSYCSLFPKKVVKKKAAEEDSAVCLVELRTPNAGSKWLIEQRPAKGEFPKCTSGAVLTAGIGLLASLWYVIFSGSTRPRSTISTALVQDPSLLTHLQAIPPNNPLTYYHNARPAEKRSKHLCTPPQRRQHRHNPSQPRCEFRPSSPCIHSPPTHHARIPLPHRGRGRRRESCVFGATGEEMGRCGRHGQ
jgi:A/G-specific adenine glycosylase